MYDPALARPVRDAFDSGLWCAITRKPPKDRFRRRRFFSVAGNIIQCSPASVQTRSQWNDATNADEPKRGFEIIIFSRRGSPDSIDPSACPPSSLREEERFREAKFALSREDSPRG